MNKNKLIELYRLGITYLLQSSENDGKVIVYNYDYHHLTEGNIRYEE